jgi:hypothetical protein
MLHRQLRICILQEIYSQFPVVFVFAKILFVSDYSFFEKPFIKSF